ncbi:aspartic peptidase domain-containing protein [Melanogaster broomeanus]|nr:aspartic peptidase domain-containing protein [Melanogaster broomeanus]
MTTILDGRSSFWKGKNEVRVHLNAREEGTGGSSGIVLSLDMVSTSYFAVAYTVPVQVGSSQQNFSLQVDTGSSDLWIASQSCSTASCSATNGRLYNPSSSRPTGATFNIQYLSGTVTGPIVWDQVQLGGYIIPNQALAAASIVQNEPMSYDFDGILGLALPLNSMIQQKLPSSPSDSPDGAALSANLLSLTPAANAPSQAFFSLTLARPGSTQLPSLLGIGRHPSEIVPDPTKIQYSPLVSESVGTLFWKTTVRAITVYASGRVLPIALQSLSGGASTALLDSGVPLIITTSQIANGIYGALGIGPASDGNYYVPCSTPLNMTITLDGQPELPIHPLDLTTEPSGQSGSQYCIGLIQPDDNQLTASSDIGDMILGVPFMRNVYTVMAYEHPDASGTFTTSVNTGISPTLGLLGLTNATQAMEEFNQVLIGLVGFFALCLALFALRCFFVRRRWRQHSSGAQLEEESGPKPDLGAYQLTGRTSQSGADDVTGDTLHALAPDSYVRKERSSQYTVDSNRTRIDALASEFGVRRHKFIDTSPDLDDPWDPHAGTWRDSIVGTYAGETPTSLSFPPLGTSDLQPRHQHTQSELMSVPLLTHRHSDSQSSDVAEFGMGPLMSMAGIGTAARGSTIDPDFYHSRSLSDSSGHSAKSSSPFRATFPPSHLSQARTSQEHSDNTPSDADRTSTS